MGIRYKEELSTSVSRTCYIVLSKDDNEMLIRAIRKMRGYKEGPNQIDQVGKILRLIVETAGGLHHSHDFAVELEPEQALSMEQALRAQLKKFCDIIASTGRGPDYKPPTCKTCGNDECPAYEGE